MNSNEYPIKRLLPEEYPRLLQEMQKPPNTLYIRGALPGDDHLFLTVVGSRRYSEYGKLACEKLIEGLSGRPIVIVSGLAYGIDSIAHRAALRHGLKTIAIPGSGLEESVITPPEHLGLAEEILQSGGALLSPFQGDITGKRWTFPVRNVVMAGISHATLVIEAEFDSGTLITAREAQDLDRTVLAVPGQIFSPNAYGSNYLIKDGVAEAVTTSADILKKLGFDPKTKPKSENYVNVSDEEKKLLSLLPLPREELIEKLGMETSLVSTLISLLELKGIIEEKLGEIRRI